MNHLSLFSGIGGADLAAEWAGMKTVAFCEREPFPQKVLRKQWPSVPIYDDVCTLTKVRLEADGIIGPGRTIDIISGGFPCQPHATVNRQRKGAADERHLWPQMFRVIDEIRPTWVVGENVADFSRSDEHEQTHKDLESIGYETQTFIISASSVGAPHRRNRTIVVAYSNHESELQTNKGIVSVRVERHSREDFTERIRRTFPRTYWEENKSPVCGVDDGLSEELDKDRLKALGNTIVPQQFYPFFAAIKAIDDSLHPVLNI